MLMPLKKTWRSAMLSWDIGLSLGSQNIVLAIFSVGFGIALLTAAIAVFEGYKKELSSQLLNIAPHLELTAPNTGIIHDYDSAIAQLALHPEIKTAAPYFLFDGAIQTKKEIVPIQLRATLGAAAGGHLYLSDYIVSGSIANLKKNTIAISVYLAQTLDLQIGSSINIFLGIKNTHGVSKPRKVAFKIVALFKTSTFADHGLGLISMKTGAHLANQSPSAAHGIAVWTENPLDLEFLRYDIHNMFQNRHFSIFSWGERYSSIFAAIALSRRLMLAMLFAIIAISTFNVIGILLGLLQERRYELIRLLIMGASPMILMRAMLVRGLVLGITGGVIGVGAGLALAYGINYVVISLRHYFGIEVFDTKVYFLDFLPIAINIPQLLGVCLVAIIFCLLASIYPAYRVFDLNPAKSLRERI